MTYAESITVQKEGQIEQELLAALAAEGVDTAGLSDLSAERGLVALSASSEARAQAIRAVVVKTVSVEDAFGPWLDIVLKGRYDEDRLPALKTQGRLLVTAPASGGTQVIAARTLRADAGGGIFFINTQGVTISAGALVGVGFECETAGTVGNVAPGAISSFQRAPAGLTVSNGTNWITFGGRDVEGDIAYRKRSKAKWTELGAGWTSEAFDFWIPRWAPTVTRWAIIDDNPNGPGSIGVYAANADGPASVEELALILAGMRARNFRPRGTPIPWALAAPTVTVTVAGTLYGNGSNPTLLASAKGGLDRLKRGLPLGAVDGFVDTSLLQGVIVGGAFPDYEVPGFTGATALTLTTPAADVAVGPNAVVQISYSGLVLG